MEEQVLEINGDIYKHGDDIIGTIEGNFFIGKLSIADIFYACQNVISGDTAKEKFGYKYSWAFNKYSNNSLSDGVIIFNKEEAELYKKFTIFNADSEFSLQYKEDRYIVKIVFDKDLYFSCCGSTIYHDISFVGADYIDKLDEKIKEAIKKIVLNACLTTNINCIIRNDYNSHIKFVDFLGFKKVDTFVNKNTDHELSLYSYNRE